MSNTALCIGMYGKDEDFYSLKGVVEELLRVLGIKGSDLCRRIRVWVRIHPGRCARISVTSGRRDGELCDELGVMGEDTSGRGRTVWDGRREDLLL